MSLNGWELIFRSIPTQKLNSNLPSKFFWKGIPIFKAIKSQTSTFLRLMIRTSIKHIFCRSKVEKCRDKG